METRANYALIGLFTLSVIAGLFGFIYWFRSAGQNGVRVPVQVIFTGSVSGLSRGATVRFNGLRVGEVTAITLVPNDPSRVAAIIEVDTVTPLKADTRARLEYQGLTGTANVQLSGGANEAPPLSPTGNATMPTIYADRSDFQDIVETVQRLSGKVDTIVTRLDRVVEDTQQPLVNTLRNAEAFSKTLADNSANVNALLSNGGEMAQRIASLAIRLERFTDEAEGLIRNVDAQSINRSVRNVESLTEGLAERRGDIDAFLANAATLSRQLSDQNGALQATLRNAETVSKALADNSGQIDTITRGLAEASQKVASVAEKADSLVASADGIVKGIDPASVSRTLGNVETFTRTLSTNQEAIDGFIRDSASLARKLNDSAATLDTALEDVSRLTRALDADAVNRVVGNADKFTKALADNSGSVDKALKDVSEITAKVNQAANRLDSVLAGAESLLSSEGSKGVIAEIGETARSIRVLADNLDKRTAEMSAGINRFTGPGLRELEALTGDARRAVGDIGRAARSLERNPQQLIFGGKSQVPEYGGRR